MVKILRNILIVTLFLGGIFAYFAYSWIWAANVSPDYEENLLTIPSGSSFDDVLNILREEDALLDENSFVFLAGVMNYKKDTVPAGKFRISPGWSNRTLISHLRLGAQEPVRLTFNQVRTLDELAGQISKYTESDSLAILEQFQDETFLESIGYNRQNLMCLFIPNTYEIYWDTKPEELISRMKREHETFWAKDDRLLKAEALGLDQNEVYTLASIVEKESLVRDEKPIIAGVYLNRLERGMLLQADPTVVFAVGDFSIQRVLNKHLEIDSPYNTYKNTGLPPGPICMPSISSIDGVLNAVDHNYIFFCAKPESGGRHAFASNLSGHNRNAKTYRDWLQANRIR